jgi:hypothetical protein
VINNVSVTRVSYNGGPGGVAARPTRMELAATHDRHVEFTPVQQQHVQFAARDHAMLASANGGRPAVAATMRPGQFSGRGVIAARAAGQAGQFGAERGQFERSTQAHFDGRSAQPFNRPEAQHYGRPPQAQEARQFNRPQGQPFERQQAQQFNRPQGQSVERPQAQRYREQAARSAAPRPEGRGPGGGEREHH